MYLDNNQYFLIFFWYNQAVLTPSKIIQTLVEKMELMIHVNSLTEGPFFEDRSFI